MSRLTADLERLLGPGHPDTLNARNSLAAAYLAAGRVADAIPLFEQTLAVLQRQLGPDHPDTLTSQNNLASAYQDAGRVAEAIQLYELNLAERERLLGVDHPGTLNSRGNLAAAYLAAGRVAEAIPLLEQTLAEPGTSAGSRSPRYPDLTEEPGQGLPRRRPGRRGDPAARADLGRSAPSTAPRSPPYPDLAEDLVTAYRDEGRVARESQAPADAAANGLSVSFRRPPADPAGRCFLAASVGLPPTRPGGCFLTALLTRPPSCPTIHSPGRTQDVRLKDAEHDREVVAAITAGDPAGIAMAYDKHAAALYSYCHWMLHDSADAAESLQDTFVLAAATLSELPEPSKLRPWLFALARNECRRRIRPRSVTRDEADAANQRADEVGSSTDAADRLTDATMPFRVVSELADTTMQFRAISDAADRLADATMPFRMVSGPADATMSFRVVSGPADATMQFRMVSGVGRRHGRPGRRQRSPGASRTAGADPLHPGRHEASRA